MKNFLKDHRIFMFSCVAALTLNGKWLIEDKDSINTSFPNFIDILKTLGYYNSKLNILPIGNFSNLLIKDRGYLGLAVKLTGNFSKITMRLIPIQHTCLGFHQR